MHRSRKKRRYCVFTRPSSLLAESASDRLSKWAVVRRRVAFTDQGDKSAALTITSLLMRPPIPGFAALDKQVCRSHAPAAGLRGKIPF